MGEIDKHSPSEFYYPEDLETLDVETETGTEFHITKNSLTELARAALGNTGPRSWQYGPSGPSRSVTKRLVFFSSCILEFKVG